MTKIINQAGFAHVVGLGLAVIVVAGVGLTGYSVMNSQKDKQQLNSSDQAVAVKEALPLSLAGLMEVSQIKELALQSSTATVIGIELESDNGVLVYEIMLSDGTVVVLNAKTGERLKTSVGPVFTDGQEDENLPADFTAKVTFEEARAIAQAKFPQSAINKLELDLENGVIVISVRFADKARVDVDATTGTVIRTKSPKGVESTEVKSKDNSDDMNKTDEADKPEAPDTDEDRDIEAVDDDGPDAPDQPDAPDAPDSPDAPETNESDSSGSNRGSGSSDSGSSGRRG